MPSPLVNHTSREANVPKVSQPTHIIPKELRKFFLEVELKVAAKDAPTFVRSGIKLLPTFESVGLKLVASAWRTSADPITVVNYWNMGEDANNLLEAELALPDIPTFNSFNRLINHEFKSIAIPIAYTERRPPELIEGVGYRYLRLTTEVWSTDLAEFGARIEAYMAPFTRAQGWFLGDTYYSTTGKAGKISQLWIVPDGLNSAKVSELLQKASWLKPELVRGPTTVEILRATPADPVIFPHLEEQAALPGV